jgi:hypothetical protein
MDENDLFIEPAVIQIASVRRLFMHSGKLWTYHYDFTV